MAASIFSGRVTGLPARLTNDVGSRLNSTVFGALPDRFDVFQISGVAWSGGVIRGRAASLGAKRWPSQKPWKFQILCAAAVSAAGRSHRFTVIYPLDDGISGKSSRWNKLYHTVTCDPGKSNKINYGVDAQRFVKFSVAGKDLELGASALFPPTDLSTGGCA